MKKLVTALLLVALLLSLSTGVLAESAGDVGTTAAPAAEPASYNAHDVEKLGAFFSLTNASGRSNGQILFGDGFSATDPTTWSNITWNEDGTLATVKLSKNTKGQAPFGVLDLNGCTTLTKLNCDYATYLEGLSVKGCTGLTSVNAKYNTKLGNVDFGDCANLEELYVDNCGMTALDVSKNLKLKKLTCTNNKLTSLDITANVALDNFSCASNQLTTLDVSKNVNLTYLGCSRNELTGTLDISGMTKLATLDCSNNKLSVLKTGSHPALTGVYCMVNQLTSLDLSGIPQLTELNCYSNRLTTLDLSGKTKLVQLLCYDNQLTTLNLTDNTLFKANLVEATEGGYIGYNAYPQSAGTRVYQIDRVTAAAKEGYKFMGWFNEDGTRLSTSADFNITSQKINHFIARFKDQNAPNEYLLSIKYLYEDKTVAADPYARIYEEGAAYSVTSPTIDGYQPDQAVVSGTMGSKNVTVTVTYKKVEPCTEHTWDDGVVQTPATCTEDGVMLYTCTKCSATKTEPIKATGHEFGEWKTSKEATCTEDGEESRSCTKCGATETRTVKATGHEFGEWKTSKEATCTEDGEETRSCTKCGATETRTIKATGHKPVLKGAKDATCTEKGYTGDEVCAVCGETLKKGEEIPAIGHDFKDNVCTKCGQKITNAKTGDSSPVAVWTVAMLVSVMGAAALVLRKKHLA